MMLHLPLSSPQPSEHLDIPLTCAKLIEETLKRTGKTLRDWQLANGLNRLTGNDTLTVAATGAGKSLTFVLAPFVLGWQSITWILSPLNVIEEQQVEIFNDWGVPTVCINANVDLESEKKKILNGDYQVVISSPETFFATNKLRKVVVAPELSNRRHFVIVDEAHVIRTWGEEFRKEYANVGILRGMLYNALFAVVTATATEPVKKAIITALYLGVRQELVVKNLGTYRKNIEYSVYRMTGGLTSLKEITSFFPSPEEVVPSLVFTDAIPDTPQFANVLRNHLGWTGELARKIISYHSLREESGKRDAIQAFKDGSSKILVATESLAMGADFADVGLVVQFGATDSVITHSVMMVTPNQYKKALALCEGVKDGGIEDGLGDMLVEDGAIEDEPGAGGGETTTGKGKKTYRRQKMDLEVARFITTQRCRVKVLDEAFENPLHESCYVSGNCDLCVARRTRGEAVGETDTHLAHRAAQREELVVILESGLERTELTHKSSTKPPVRTGKELTWYQAHLHHWLEQKFLEESEKRYIGPEDIMTDAALDSIARSRNTDDLASFDSLKPLWTQRGRWE
ncbi:hypothetical protein FRC10_008299 [Ceratobasidium sp. 414]|nr:hypothetical protein FRC10_008299 [Ceratobasidium sp. 414]